MSPRFRSSISLKTVTSILYRPRACRRYALARLAAALA
jgi:hypothetical protein